MNTVLSLENISKSFGNFDALRDVSFNLKKGEFLTLFGQNGAGKTTLLKIVAGISSPTAGNISVFGTNILENDDGEIKKKIGVISHNTYLYNNLTAYENLEFYGELYHVKNLKERIEEVLCEVELESRMHTLSGTFSKGMSQRLAIARAILHKPSLILLDEPYTGLDQHSSIRLRNLLNRLHHEETTIIMTTHNIEIGFESCTELALLHNGEIAYREKSENLTYELFREQYFHHLEEVQI